MLAWLRLRSDGRIALELKTAWHDGTRELVFEPLELLERLAAMTPRPETNLLNCHGLLAARARWRARVVAYGRVAPEPTALAPPLGAGAKGTKAKTGSPAWTWAALMHRALAMDVLACANCGGCACGSSGAAVCGAGGVMTWERGRGEGARGRGGR